MKSELIIRGARQNNLKNVSLAIRHDAVTVVTGLSGSGKSSLAFDTVFAEGQWRYIESLSTYAAQFLEKLDRPDVDELRNVRPAIALEQRNPVRTSRSTLGTVSEIYDYFRLLFARVSRLYCPRCGNEVRRSHPDSIAETLLKHHSGKRLYILFRVPVPEGGLGALLLELQARGFSRVKIREEILEVNQIDPSRRDLTELVVLLDRIVARSHDRSRIVESLESALREGKGEVLVQEPGEKITVFSQALTCTVCDLTFDPPQPLLFSFNHPLGACPECNGFGNILRYDEDLIVPDKQLSLKEGAVDPWAKPSYRWWMRQMLTGAKKAGIDVNLPYRELPEADRKKLFSESKYFSGLDEFFEYLQRKRYKLHVRVFLSRYRSPAVCPVCTGTRLKPEALTHKVNGLNIAQVSAIPIQELREWFRHLDLSGFERQAAKDILRQIEQKLTYFLRVGLGYLTVDRQTRTLSGGEAQRVNLSNQLALKLTGTLYVLDEPSIGLHPRDTDRLAAIIRELSRGGNTVLMVEHDRTLIQAADHVVEMGPGAGERGGRVVFEGTRDEFLNSSCLTARYINGEERIPLPVRRRSQDRRFLDIRGASENNLKNIDVRIPLRTLTCVTGVSGSGKSTLVQDTLYRALARHFAIDFEAPGKYRELTGMEHVKGVRLIDQDAIGRSPRSNPVTYIKAFDLIRKLFAGLPDARRKHFTPGHFSFNVPGGRCPGCEGAGVRRIEMYFFEDIYITCDECRGHRYKPEVLKVLYKGRSIAQVLQMTVREATAFFEGHNKLQELLRSLLDVGLGYLRLGQPATTLSGGESQRLKISHELGNWKLHDMVYILDEPTTGLHMDDVRNLLDVLGRLVDAGNTVIVVEHNLDVIKTADWVIDLGPEGGDEGGRILAEGRPEDVAGVDGSHTGRYLREYLGEAALQALRPADMAGA
jgi:excinuclease ABC subunit A